MFNSMGRTTVITDELAALSEAQSSAPNAEARNEVFGRIKELQQRLRRIKTVHPFEYSHQGSLAYIGKERAVADISWFQGNFATGGSTLATLPYLMCVRLTVEQP